MVKVKDRKSKSKSKLEVRKSKSKADNQSQSQKSKSQSQSQTSKLGGYFNLFYFDNFFLCISYLNYLVLALVISIVSHFIYITIYLVS